MKRHLLLFYICLVPCLSSAQAGQWVWLHGDSVGNDPGNFGTQGIASSTNMPPGFYEPCEWTDLNGNFWLYGGVDATLFNTYSDLWKYDPVANEWTWMTGTGTPNDLGSYGIQGIPSPSNRPPARGWGQPSWVDMNGNLWMFAGSNIMGKYEDLWMYNISTNEWTWMNGPGTPGGTYYYGVMGNPDPLNQPPFRDETSATWTVPSGGAGDLWLFGGDYQVFTTLNDLWRFNIATNTWTWMNGSDIMDQIGTYGIRGVEDAANTPGGRRIYCKWKDNSNNLWLFGGWDDHDSIYYNDLWRYNPVTNMWAWINGSDTGIKVSDTVNFGGNYGTQCLISADNMPGVRYENRVAWVDKDGNFWMFGGGHDYLYRNYWSATWNDLWKYCLKANKWIWVGGDTVPNLQGNWGKQGVSSPTNKPVPVAGAVGFYGRGLSGEEYIYEWGGSDSSMTFYNDIIRYTIDSACANCNAVVPVASFQSSDSSICAYDCINFTDLSINARSWSWSFPGGIPSTSTDQNPQNICYLNGGSFDVKLIVNNSGITDTLLIPNCIKVFVAPLTPVITQVHQDTLYCSTDPSYYSYQWYLNDTLIAGATDTMLVIYKSGNYNVKVADINGCAIAVGINVILGFMDYAKNHLLSLYPNPVGKELIIQNAESGMKVVSIYNAMGQLIWNFEIRNPKSEIDVSSLSAGIYFVVANSDKERWVGKFVKE